MGAMRVTQGLMINRSLNDLSFQVRKLLELQHQLATGLKVNSPSDDPLAARRAVNIRASIAKNEQYTNNISSAGPQLLESTTSIQTVVSSLQRVQELVIEGGTGTVNQVQMNQIAIEVNQVLEGVLDEANHQTNGRYVFGGTRTLKEPFVATRDANNQITGITYQGNDKSIEIAVADGATVAINQSGDRVFQSQQDLFQTLINIRDNLQAGDKTSLQGPRLAELKTSQDQLLIATAALGSTQNRLDTLTANTDNFTQQLTSDLSDNIDGDYAETVINLNAQSNAYQAALNSAARVIQPSLLDYIQ